LLDASTPRFFFLRPTLAGAASYLLFSKPHLHFSFIRYFEAIQHFFALMPRKCFQMLLLTLFLSSLTSPLFLFFTHAARAERVAATTSPTKSLVPHICSLSFDY
jgi:hypothetical protein